MKISHEIVEAGHRLNNCCSIYIDDMRLMDRALAGLLENGRLVALGEFGTSDADDEEQFIEGVLHRFGSNLKANVTVEGWEEQPDFIDECIDKSGYGGPVTTPGWQQVVGHGNASPDEHMDAAFDACRPLAT